MDKSRDPPDHPSVPAAHTAATARSEQKKLGNDLAVRAVAALVMAVVAFAATWISLWTFAALILLLSVIAAWEWQRIIRVEAWLETNRATGVMDRRVTAHAGATGLAIGLSVIGLAGPALFGTLIAAVAFAIITRNGFVGLGVVATSLPAMALLLLRRDETGGLAAVLFVFIVVWVTDTAALFWGRSLGGRKLWPSISPNKTWAGALGGAGTATIAGFLFGVALPPAAPDRLAALALALSIAAQCGDLAISALKRRFGRKDASRLIPGHGGVLDRVDGLLLAATAAGLIALLSDPRHPGAALLGF